MERFSSMVLFHRGLKKSDGTSFEVEGRGLSSFKIMTLARNPKQMLSIRNLREESERGAWYRNMVEEPGRGI